MDHSLPSSSVHGISQPRTLECIAIPSPGDPPDPGIKPTFPVLAADSLPLNHLGSPILFYRWRKEKQAGIYNLDFVHPRSRRYMANEIPALDSSICYIKNVDSVRKQVKQEMQHKQI